MEYLEIVLIPIIIGILLSTMDKAARKAEASMSDNEFTVRQPKIAFWIGVICLIIFSLCIVLMTIFPNGTAEWWVYVLFILISALGASLAVYCIRWKIRIFNKRLIFSSVFVKNRVIELQKVTRVVQKPQAIKVYSGNKRCFTVETNCVGYLKLCDLLKREGIPFE